MSGLDAVVKELTQIHDKQTFSHIAYEDITLQEHVEMVSSLMFLKEKRDSTTKGSFCVDGSTQRACIKKKNATSLTVHKKFVFVTLVIAVHEWRKQAIFDVMGAFLITDGNEDVIIQLKGALTKLMYKVIQVYTVSLS